ncbi:MAG: peptide chain release factor 1 [Deltaproteobacteria bacterium]|nr:peptide chain release factor 1 [Deltaproteobacteria bacterium]
MLLEKLKDIEKKYNELSEQLASPEVLNNQKLYQQYAKEHSTLGEIVEVFQETQKIESELAGNRELLEGKDEEMRTLAKEEMGPLQKTLDELNAKITLLLLPKDPNDDKNIIIEIRAGAGGDESALFAAELFRMYSRYGEELGWKVEVLSSNPTGQGGIKEVIAEIIGKGAYSRLKFESGVHRVQRVPETESSGRRHTSTATVAVMPEAEEVEVDIKSDDLRIDTFRAGGHGGQSVNKIESAVRITHIPSGIVVNCQDEKSQHKNRQKAMKILLTRLLDKEIREKQAEESAHRKSQVGTGDRSEKIRTYSFPQNRVTDHRIGLTLHKLEEIMDGDLKELTDSIIGYFQAEALKQAGEEASS